MEWVANKLLVADRNKQADARHTCAFIVTNWIIWSCVTYLPQLRTAIKSRGVLRLVFVHSASI